MLLLAGVRCAPGYILRPHTQDKEEDEQRGEELHEMKHFGAEKKNEDTGRVM